MDKCYFCSSCPNSWFFIDKFVTFLFQLLQFTFDVFYPNCQVVYPFSSFLDELCYWGVFSCGLQQLNSVFPNLYDCYLNFLIWDFFNLFNLKSKPFPDFNSFFQVLNGNSNMVYPLKHPYHLPTIFSKTRSAAEYGSKSLFKTMDIISSNSLSEASTFLATIPAIIVLTSSSILVLLFSANFPLSSRNFLCSFIFSQSSLTPFPVVPTVSIIGGFQPIFSHFSFSRSNASVSSK
ncbi:233aa long hypothetical protein [Pyrococcus horikoshii OT3]|uniref:Uncharacterized protein n=1 Tax=Pyrococcus horikoshii (strain ATCC 700860 / DSM 12428 / JCM 9974 / NBRC 100139 / OT-3) TaxID=70601 RepID=O58011_PYRHO|nr:233aa long hypothetical protein [Pyrococcus horikoshii OT3]